MKPWFVHPAVINALVWALVIVFAGIYYSDALKQLLPLLVGGAAFSIIYNGMLGKGCR